jgi:hypothetical protein
MSGRIGSCPSDLAVRSYVWQINMRTATAPSVISATLMGSNSCFYDDPVLDPQGTGIAWFSNEDSYHVRCSVTRRSYQIGVKHTNPT